MNGAGFARPWRGNILALAAALVLVAIGSMYASVVVTSEALQTGFQSLGTIAVTGLVAFGKDILTMDSSPFDASEAAHTERMAELTAISERQAKQMELDHEYRNGQNAAMQALIAAATGTGIGGSGHHA